MSELTLQVKQNLQYYTLWTDVTVHQMSLAQPLDQALTQSTPQTQNLTEQLEIISGYPPQKLTSADKDHSLEWVIPIFVNSQANITVKNINYWFQKIKGLTGIRPVRVTVALVNVDSTVVYYFVHDGLVKPVQN